jgi:double-stranded uracil-DNA glycosylase
LKINPDLHKKPSKQDLLDAFGKQVPDVIAPDLKILFCGINPGLYSGAVGHHFARPGNRFWPTLYQSGLTHRLLSPNEEHLLLEYGYGITNLVERATASAGELSKIEIEEGGTNLRDKVIRYKPSMMAVLGIGAFRQAFDRRKVRIGSQPEKIGLTKIWVLPNPSGLNAHYRLSDLVILFKELKDANENG